MTQSNARVEAPANTSTFYEMLFCDDIDLYRETITDHSEYPWNVLFNDSADIRDLLKVLSDRHVETRVKMLAAHRLQAADYQDGERELLAVIIENSMQHGLDVLASYRDGRVRYLNYSGHIVFWEALDAHSNALVDELFTKSEDILNAIGPWDRGRLNPPSTGNLRITLLATDGLYFGEAAQDVLFNDGLAGPALGTATRILQHISSNVN